MVAVIDGRLRDRHYSGVLRRTGATVEQVVEFDDRNPRGRVIDGRFSLPRLSGNFSLKRNKEAAAATTLAGEYAFVDNAMRLWSVVIDRSGSLQATSGDCTFQGQVLSGLSAEAGPLRLGLTAGACSPFAGATKATAYLAANVVDTRDALRVIFTDRTAPFDLLWFPE